MIHGGPTDWTEPWQDRRDARLNFRTPATHGDKTITARSTRRHIQQRWADMLVRSIQHAGFESRAIWAESSMFKGSGRWLSGPGGAFYGRYTFRSPLEYTMSLRMRLLLPPASSDVGAPGPFLCSCGSTVDPDEMPFHCLDCSNSQFFNIHRHNAVRDTTIDLLNAVAPNHTSILSVFPHEPLVLPPSDTTSVSDLCDEATGHNSAVHTGPRQSVTEFRTSRAHASNSGRIRADAGFITSTNRRFIDMTISNPAAPSYYPPERLDSRGRLRPPTYAGHTEVHHIRTDAKRAHYRPILGDLVNDPEHLAIFLVEATGRLSEDSMKLAKFIVKDSASRSILNLFCTQIGGAIARYNAMAAHAWVQYYLRSSHISVGEVAG
jgi:hypothetical protein